MAVNFGLLQPAQPVSAFFQGQQDVRAEADRNLLRQQQAEQLEMQRENMLAQRQQRELQTAELRAKAERAAQRKAFLTDLGAKMAQEGYKLNRPTLGQVLQFGMETGEDMLVKIATEGMRALDEEERDAAEMARIRPTAGTAAPSIMRQPAAAGLPAAPAAPTNMLAGTPFDIGTVQPAPVNALAAPPAAPAAAPAAAEPMVGGFTRSQIAEMAASNVKSVRERGEKLSKLLPKEPTVPASVQELEAYLKMTPEQKAAFERLHKIKSPSVTATATSTTPTAKSLAGPVGARAETSLVKAEGAAGIMESANMVREALNSGNVIAGPLAGVRTKFAQVLELAGAGDKEKLVNTRTAIQGLATLTLESRAELKGQGQVTENEQKLLERARSGNIEDMTIAELQQVVNVSQRLANRLWSSHQTLLKTMETDPAAADSLRYYRPTVSLPSALGEGRPKAEEDKRKEGLGKIFGAQPQR